ncbi:MAG TPA: DNA-processing protein DprA [Pyrinomonadaceae bacterium]|jgi:DNA processing protein|nr:DNA-processing protein DprA [Pyrinomonadaceae bacterium]
MQTRIKTLDILTLLSTPGIGRRTVQQLLEAELESSPSSLLELRDLLVERASVNGHRMRIPTSMELQDAYRVAERVLESSHELGVQVIGPDTQMFPRQLREIPDPPVMLYVLGNAQCLYREPAVAVIGTREPSQFGLSAAEKLSATLAAQQFVIVSGLAIGCDAAAHTGCLNAGGQTLAVLAHGLDHIYPSKNRDLAHKILDSGGCLVSEYAPGTRPRGNFFVERDRLQSGLSAAVIVIETGLRGGTMHTAQFCIDQHRLLACVVHPPKFASHEKARGNQMLIAEGKALPLSSRADIDSFVARFQTVPKTNESEKSMGPTKKRTEQLSFFSEWAS